MSSAHQPSTCHFCGAEIARTIHVMNAPHFTGAETVRVIVDLTHEACRAQLVETPKAPRKARQPRQLQAQMVGDAAGWSVLAAAWASKASQKRR
jgi:hypothetical protein